MNQPFLTDEQFKELDSLFELVCKRQIKDFGNISAVYNYNLNLDELERLTFLEISKNCLKNNNKVKNNESICNIPR